MIKTTIIFLMALSVTLNANCQEENTDNPLITKLNEFKCDTATHSSFFTWESAPICETGYDNFARNMTSLLDLDKRLKGDFLVSFLINCKGEVDFVRITPFKKGKRVHSMIHNETKSFKDIFSESGTWKPATSNGKYVDSEHVLMLRLKKGQIVEVTEYLKGISHIVEY